MLALILISTLAIAKNKPAPPPTPSVVVGAIWKNCARVATLSPDIKEDCKNVLLPAFWKIGNAWTDQGPSQVSTDWTLAFQGQDIGTIPHSALKPSSDQPFMVIDAATVVAWDKVPKAEFSKFDGYVKKRPIAVVSAKATNDPDEWKPVTLSAADRTLMWDALKKARADEFTQMGCPAKCPSIDAAKIDKAYRSKAGVTIARIELPTSIESEIPGVKRTIGSWFQVKAGAQPLLARDLEGWSAALVNAADYDHTGHSKLLFMVSGFDMSGFVLLDENFKTLATYTYSYQ